eukprot:CAMPEP_0178607068 /NCGR_PEP_ID=MMETSP0697-20121206/37418_1 /TAXON_ID=265572 /ORGANISM="Extubocellulus spinifer, Strain CCMP396" /LENGTH=517 /DNA_ID=CAMNT_0020245557 /DNA_START=132 /DNA_END=1685 /DNA_ORIENTATION=-
MSSRPSKSEPWRQNPTRHYCPLCSVWMASDRTSIAVHENGRKHREAAEANLQKRRGDKLEEERKRKEMESSLAAIERAAGRKMEEDLKSGAFGSAAGPVGGVGGYPTGGAFASAASAASAARGASALPTGTCASSTAPAVPHHASTAAAAQKPAAGAGTEAKAELTSWNERKNKRKAAADAYGIDKKQRTVRKLADDEGHYVLNTSDGTSSTYLEGKVYAPILEEDVPIQIWTGETTASEMASVEREMRRLDRQHLWKMGLVVRVRKREKGGKDTGHGDGGKSGSVEESLNGGEKDATASPPEAKDGGQIMVDVAYLRNPTDENETIEKAVEPYRIRLLLGSDEMIPSTIEEARLDLMGGEEIINDADVSSGAAAAPAIDENTGLATWGTVQVRKVSANRQIKEERARVRAKRREEAERARQQERQEQERKMEEAKVANADDSALGSYDVWSGGKAGYKGVDIARSDKVDVADTAKSLAKGKGGVAFKKRKSGGGGGSAFKNAKKKANRRVTSADDD